MICTQCLQDASGVAARLSFLGCVGGGAERAAPRASLAPAPRADRTPAGLRRELALDGPIADALVIARVRAAPARRAIAAAGDGSTRAPRATAASEEALPGIIGNRPRDGRRLHAAFDLD
jgi:hypothetical protein